MKRSFILALGAVILAGSVFTGCKSTEKESSSVENNVQNIESTESNDKNIESTETTENENADSSEVVEELKADLDDDVEADVEEVKAKEDTDLKLTVDDVTNDLEFGTPWKQNAEGTKEMAIEGRGPEAIEEGIGFVYVKDETGTKSIALGGKGDSLAPKYVEWSGENSILMHTGNRYGRSHLGGSLYEIDLSNMKPILLYEAKEDEEIVEATKISADIINIKMLKYNSEATISVEKNIKIK